jgi:putative transposase
MMAERGVKVDHSTLNRWVMKFAPLLEKIFRSRKCMVGSSWRMDESYIKFQGQWKYLYRAADKSGNTVDFLLAAKLDRKAARRFFKKAIGTGDTPEKINIDQSGANTAGIESFNYDHGTNIEIFLSRRLGRHECKYLNNIVEQDHRFIKKVVGPMLSFKNFRAASATIAGIELMHMIRKGQMRKKNGWSQTFAQQFYSLAA